MSDKFKDNPALRDAVYKNHKKWLDEHTHEVAEYDRKFSEVLNEIHKATGMQIHFAEVDNLKGNRRVGDILADALNDPGYTNDEKFDIASRLAIVDPKPHKKRLISLTLELQAQPSIPLDIIMQNIERYADENDADALEKMIRTGMQSPFLIRAYLRSHKGTTEQTLDVLVIALSSEVMVEEAISQIGKRGLKGNPLIKARLDLLLKDDPLNLTDKFIVLGGNRREVGNEQIERIRNAIKNL